MRRFFQTKDGKWAEPFIEGDFEDDGAAYAAEVAKKLGVATLKVVEVEDGDPREGELLAEPTPPVPAKTARAAAFEDLDAATTIAQMKAALKVILGG